MIDPLTEYEAQQAEITQISEWLYSEDEVERDIEKAVEYSRRSDKNLIVAGMYAARIVGRYEKNGAKAIADRAGRSVSSVENWAHGYMFLLSMFRGRKFGVDSEIVRQWRTFTPTHFWTLWDKAEKYNMSLHRCVDYLGMMLNYRINGEAWSASALSQEIEAHENRSGHVASWNWYAPKAKDFVLKLLSLSDLPDVLRPGLLAIFRDIEELEK